MFSGLISSATQLITALILVKYSGFGANSVLLAPTLGNTVAVLFIELFSKNIKDFGFNNYDKQLAKNIIAFSLPLSVNSLAFWAMNNINKYFAAYFIDYKASSYITIAAKLTLALSLITSVFTLAWQEATFENSNSEDRGLRYRDMCKAYLYLFTFGTSLFILFISIIFPYYIGSQYYESYVIIPIYFISVYFAGISSFFGTIYSAEKMTKRLMYTTIMGTAVNVVLILLFIKNQGIISIPICATLGNAVCMLVRYRTISKQFNLYIKLMDVIVLTIEIVGSVVIAYMVSNTLILTIMSIIIAVLMFIVCYYVLYRKTNILKTILKNY
jgi:O-antigen/teichoic acid export membrane protein